MKWSSRIDHLALSPSAYSTIYSNELRSFLLYIGRTQIVKLSLLNLETIDSQALWVMWCSRNFIHEKFRKTIVGVIKTNAVQHFTMYVSDIELESTGDSDLWTNLNSYISVMFINEAIASLQTIIFSERTIIKSDTIFGQSEEWWTTFVQRLIESGIQAECAFDDQVHTCRFVEIRVIARNC